MLKTALLPSVLLSLLIVPCAQASNWYWGAGGGAAKIKGLCNIDTGLDCDDSGLVVRGLGGYQLNRAVAFEAALDIGVGYDSPYIYSRYDESSNLGYVMLQAQTVFFIPVAKTVSLIAGVGACISSVSYEEEDEVYTMSSSTLQKQQKTSGNQPVSDWFDDDYDSDNDNYYDDDDDDDGSDLEACGSGLIGVQVGLTEKSSLRIQNQYYFDVDGDAGFHGKKDINAFSINFIRKF